MLKKNDLEQIRGIMKDEIAASEERMIKNVTNHIVVAVGEIVEQNIMPQFDGVYAKFDGISAKFDGIHRRLNRIEAMMVTKDFLEERLERFKEGLQNSALWVGRRVNRLTDILYHNGTITAEQVLEVHQGQKAA